MKKIKFTLLLFFAAVMCNAQTVQMDSLQLQKIINEAKYMQLQINDVNSRLESYAQMNNIAFIVTLVGGGLIGLYIADGSKEDAFLYAGVGLSFTGVCMLYFNSNKLKLKWQPYMTPAVVSR